MLVAVVLGGCAEPHGPQAGVDVLHYAVDLSVAPEARSIEGRARLQVVRADSVRVLQLGLDGPAVLSVTVDGATVPAGRRGDRISVPLPEPDTFTDTLWIEVAYRGTPATGLYAAAGDGGEVVFTDGWPDRVRGWLPGHHHPADPATLDLTLRVPPAAGRAVIATGARTPADAPRIGRWRLDVPAPTYTFAFAIGPFMTDETALGDTLVVRHHRLGPGGRRAALARTPEMLAFFEALLGPYPFPVYASAEVPIPWAGMENTTLSFLQPALFASGTAAEAVQVHEVAHHWFGNQVVLANWRDLWLAEGMSSYLTTRFYEHADGPDAARARLADMTVLPDVRRRAYGTLVPAGDVDPEAHLGWLPYRKGGSVLHLLRLRMGDPGFRAALREVVLRFSGRPLSTEDFLAVLASHTPHDLDAFARYWIYGDDLPRLRTGWDADAKMLRWHVTGDEGTLAGLPFELEIVQEATVRYVDARSGTATLTGTSAPQVRPVGVVLLVE